MKIKLKEARGIAGVPHQIGDVVDVPEKLAREFAARGWAETEGGAGADTLAMSKKGDIGETVALIAEAFDRVSEKLGEVIEDVTAITGRVDEMEAKLTELETSFDIDPELMTGPEVENREADLAQKTAKRDADTKKKGK